MRWICSGKTLVEISTARAVSLLYRYSVHAWFSFCRQPIRSDILISDRIQKGSRTHTMDMTTLRMALIGYEAQRQKIQEKIGEIQRQLSGRTQRAGTPV